MYTDNTNISYKWTVHLKSVIYSILYFCTYKSYSQNFSKFNLITVNCFESEKIIDYCL